MCCLFLYINKHKKSNVQIIHNPNNMNNTKNKKGIKCPKCKRIFYEKKNLKSHFWCLTKKELKEIITNNK